MEKSWAWWGRPAPALPLRHAVRILEQGATLEGLVLESGPPLDRALQAHQRSHRGMGRNDRLLLGTAVYGLARNREAIRKALPDAAPGEGRLLLLALIDALAKGPGEIPHLPGGVAPWLTAVDRLASHRSAWARTLDEAWHEDPAQTGVDVRAALASLFSIPEWWLDAGPWSAVGEASEEIARLKQPQRLTLRAQVHRGTRVKALSELSALGIPARATERSPWGIGVEGRHNVLATELYRSGLVEVQDEGSQLVACACDPKPGERVLDLCAGGGGKSLALGSLMGGKGQIIAHDADPMRLSDTRNRARRAGLGNIRTLPDLDEVERLGPYDLVLVDAPCTSSGTLRRNPDAAWRWDRESLARLLEVQAGILDTAVRLVAAGGSLVYVTCSLLVPENQGQVERFLARHAGFEPAPLGDRRGHQPLLDVPGADTGVFRLPANLPRYAGDAFFVARLRRH